MVFSVLCIFYLPRASLFIFCVFGVYSTVCFELPGKTCL